MAKKVNSDSFRTDFSCLPEGCTAHVLSLTSPLDACRLSLVSRAFKFVADSNIVWENFFPCDYQSILSQSSSSVPLGYSSRKELFFHLCEHPILIDNGRKSFSLDKWTGKKCYMLAARDIIIKGSDHPKISAWISLPDSRFPEVAYLINIGWLEIRGKIKTAMLSSGTNYAAYLVFKWSTDIPQCFWFLGNQDHPIESSVHICGQEKHVKVSCFGLQHPMPKKREDGWFEFELGEYFNGGGEDSELEIELMEVNSSLPKFGLIVQGIEVRPKKDA